MDECAENCHVCRSDQKCENTYGSYKCFCYAGIEIPILNLCLSLTWIILGSSLIFIAIAISSFLFGIWIRRRYFKNDSIQEKFDGKIYNKIAYQPNIILDVPNEEKEEEVYESPDDSSTLIISCNREVDSKARPLLPRPSKLVIPKKKTCNIL